MLSGTSFRDVASLSKVLRVIIATGKLIHYFEQAISTHCIGVFIIDFDG